MSRYLQRVTDEDIRAMMATIERERTAVGVSPDVKAENERVYERCELECKRRRIVQLMDEVA